MLARDLESFLQAGDSGAYLLNDRGQMVVIMAGRCEVTKVSYFTGVDNLFHDIKIITGAQAVRLPEL